MQQRQPTSDRLSNYRTIAQKEGPATDGNNYKGLQIMSMPGLHSRVAEILAHLLPGGATILELASGTGALAARLTDAGFCISASDAVEENFRLHGRVPFYKVDLDAPFAATLPRQFQAVVAVEILEHLENPRHVFRQCIELLEPGESFSSPPRTPTIRPPRRCTAGMDPTCGLRRHITSGTDISRLSVSGSCPSAGWRQDSSLRTLHRSATPTVISSHGRRCDCWPN